MVETIWSYLESKGFQVEPRDAKHTVHLVLESEKLNGAQKRRMPDLYHVSEKLDGVYSLVSVVEGEVRHWGRSGKALSNCELLDVRVKTQLPYSGNIILISEITAGVPLAELSGYLTPSRVEEAVHIIHMDDNFHDLLPLEDFLKGSCGTVFANRRTNLDHVLSGTSLNIIPCISYTDLKDATAFAKNTMFPKGSEGLVLRDPRAPWVAGARNETAIKIKEKLSFDVTVVGMCSGKEGSKYENTLGKLVVVFPAHGKSGNELLEIPISGMKDAQRDYWWTHEEDIVGHVVKLDAKSFTAPGNLREPRFKEVRTDKDSQFPVKVLSEINEYTKGKALWRVHNYEVVL